jgi:hypothetical protein
MISKKYKTNNLIFFSNGSSLKKTDSPKIKKTNFFVYSKDYKSSVNWINPHNNLNNFYKLNEELVNYRTKFFRP